jgi:ubiquinone/menaquinone biosynthesis C-methylase UbiE
MTANAGQYEHWNAEEGEHWVTHQQGYDTQLRAFGDRMLQAALIGPTDKVLDVGCGTGATTLAAAVATRGDVLGVDLSQPMLQVARARATALGRSNVRFEQADAQTHPFTPAGFDVVISRFGVMFFDDPVAAFANLARATRPGGRLVVTCWQELVANEFVLVPSIALAALFLTLPFVPASSSCRLR